MKKLNEKETRMREITYNPFDLFFSRKIVPGQFVTVGYVKDSNVESPKILGQKNNIADNDDELQEYLDEYANTLWAQDFAGITMDSGYQAALNGTKKTAKFEIDGEIIRVQRFTYQWRDPRNFGKAFDKEAEEMLQARAKYGFGQGFADEELGIEDPDEWYDEDDWRRKPKYMGTGLRQRGLKKNGSSGYRFSTPAPGLYAYSGTDPDKMHNMAIRNMLDPRQNSGSPEEMKKSGYKSVYYYVAPNGTMEEMPDDFVNFVRYAYKGVRNTKAAQAEEMGAEEKEFNELISAIQKKYAEKQQPTDLLFDQILYITASPIEWNEKAWKKVDGKRVQTPGKPMVFVNNRALYKTFPFLKAREMNKVIGNFCTSIETGKIERVTESLRRRIRFNKLRRLNEARVQRTIDPKLWASVSSGISKTYKNDLGASAKPMGTRDQLLQRFVAGLIILKQQCPISIDDMLECPAFNQWAAKLVEMGVEMSEVHKLWNENCGSLPKVDLTTVDSSEDIADDEPVMMDDIQDAPVVERPNKFNLTKNQVSNIMVNIDDHNGKPRRKFDLKREPIFNVNDTNETVKTSLNFNDPDETAAALHKVMFKKNSEFFNLHGCRNPQEAFKYLTGTEL